MCTTHLMATQLPEKAAGTQGQVSWGYTDFFTSQYIAVH